MGTKIPLTGSTNGRPITVSDSVLTPIQQSRPDQADSLNLTVMNTTGGAIILTISQNAVTASVSIAANGSFPLETVVADGDLLQMQGAAVGLRVMGSGDREVRYKN